MGGISGKKRGKIMITIRLKDGKELHLENEVPLFEAGKKISKGLVKVVLVAKVKGVALNQLLTLPTIPLV